MAMTAPSPSERPDVTVLVPTYRRPQRLQRLLAAVVEQQAPFSWELLVVDNDVDGSARSIVEPVRRAGIPVRYVVETALGAVHARNRGIREAAGRVVAMLDDDVVPRSGWLATVCAPLLDGAASGAGGPVFLDAAVARPRWFDEVGIGGYLTAHSLGTERRALADDEILVTANAAFDRDALQRVGGFDARFGPRGHVQIVADDAHLVRQLMRAGGTLLWLPDAVVDHDLPPERLSRRYLLRRAYWQGRSDWLLWGTDHVDRRLRGARVGVTLAGSWLRSQWHARRAAGIHHPTVAFHTACDLARFGGFLAQVVRTSAARDERVPAA
jgi:glycosyltransferase involved in cell wall biosynthesis